MTRTVLAAILSTALASAAGAAALLPGTTLTGADYIDDRILTTDPLLSPALGTGEAVANRTEDGIVDFSPDVIEGLYNVNAILRSTALSLPTGTGFLYEIGVEDFSGAGTNGVATVSVSGFAGYMVDVAPVSDTDGVYAPDIIRSADGDTITFDFSFGNPSFNLLIPGFEGLFIEPYLISTDAPSFSLAGNGSAEILVDTFGIASAPLSGPIAVPAAVPVPAGLPLLLLGLGTLVLRRRR